MTADQDARVMLARIEERVRAMAEDVAELKATRRCPTHAEKIRNVERVLYGMMTVVFGLIGKAVHDLFR